MPRSLRLGFDAFGRVAVMYDGIYSVLNDSAWVDRIDSAATSRVRMSRIVVANGRYYYGGRGSWGTADQTADGRLRASPLVPTDAPPWTHVTPFNKLLATAEGMYFYELNGLVYWNFSSRTNQFFEMPRLSAAFPVGGRVFVSCQDRRIRELLPASGECRLVTGTGLDGEVVDFAAPLDGTHTLLALNSGRLVLFDGQSIEPWPAQSIHRIEGRVSSMERLVDGGVAIAVAGTGIHLFSADGRLRWLLGLPEFQRIGDMAAGEPGVLWVATENAIHRIFYDSPMTSFGQQLGLTAIWPEVASWNERIVVCSGDTLYEAEPGRPGHPPTFRPLTETTTERADFIAANGAHLLVGNSTGVVSVGLDRTTTSVARIDNVAGLEFIQPDTCIVIGSGEIAALKHADGRWTECAPRIAGVGDAPIHLTNHDALWIEMGGDRIARLTLRDDTLDFQRVPLPWREEQWTNVGVIGDTIILSGASGRRTYFDEATKSLRPFPELDKLLDRSPYPLLRVTEDESGVLWATHVQGVITFTPRGDDFIVDSTTFELRNDSYPAVTILPGNNIWITAARSLYHVTHPATRTHNRPRPALVSLVASQQNLELLDQAGVLSTPPEFSFDNNSLSFRFFSGTYAWRTPPAYEFRLDESEPWIPVDPTMLLRLPKLRDGDYRLEVRQAGPHDMTPSPFAFSFVIKPPWYRTRLAHAAGAVALLVSLFGIARWINHRSLRRNVELEHLVRQRTSELEVTMEKLGEETRNAATLAERSRLAGEIHDSVQQGLSGAILHLDTTMTHPSLTSDLYSQLNVMRSMLSYSREEVQQAVWNLESPLLQNATLGDALRKLAGYIDSGSSRITVTAQPEPVSLEPEVQHNLLRIAQEAMTNAVKHAGAGHIDVTLQAQSSSVVMSVTDDGRGFDPTACSRIEGHFGLRGLRLRAKAIDAGLEIVSTPGSGATVRVTVLLKESSSDDVHCEDKAT